MVRLTFLHLNIINEQKVGHAFQSTYVGTNQYFIIISNICNIYKLMGKIYDNKKDIKIKG